jgi:hypothetical protein
MFLVEDPLTRLREPIPNPVYRLNMLPEFPKFPSKTADMCIHRPINAVILLSPDDIH